MARQVQIASGQKAVALPDGNIYTEGDVVTLTDAEWGRVDPDIIGTVVLDQGDVEDHAHGGGDAEHTGADPSHSAATVSVDPTGLVAVTSSRVQAALAELDAAVGGGGTPGFAIDEANLATEPSARGTDAIAIGDAAEATGVGSVAIGPGAKARTNSVSIGTQDNYRDYAVAIGHSAGVTSSAVGVGYGARGLAEFSVAIGRAADAGGAIHGAGVALGNAAQAVALYAVAIGQGVTANFDGAVAIGKDSAGVAAAATVADDFILGTATHNVKVAGTFEMTTADRGIILRSPNGTRYKVSVDDTGALTTVAA